MKFVIMAGGTGSKLWPLSRRNAPKQFIKVIGEKTLFQLTVESLLRRFSPEDIFVSMTEDVAHFVEAQAPMLSKENYIIEPMMKDTGPASCFAMAKVAAKYPEEVVYFYVQAVCTREPADKFLDMVETMELLIREEGYLMTGTIIPKYTETGSDLMKLGNKRILENGMEVYQVEEFINVVKERMTAEQVEEIRSKFTVGTHTNHLTWRPKEFFEAVALHRPDWMAIVEELKAVIGRPEEKDRVKEIYARFEPNRIEVLTTELIKEGKVMVIKLPFDWSHITTWDDVYRYRKEKGILTYECPVIEIESENNLVISKKKTVALIGMKDVAVVETDDALLIMPKSMGGKIKEVTDCLEKEGEDELL